MYNSFFRNLIDQNSISRRINELKSGKIGFYSIGLYPASLAYNSAMQTNGQWLLLAPRPNRSLLGAFDSITLSNMDSNHLSVMSHMSMHYEGNNLITNKLSDLILRCDLVLLSANSNYIEEDLMLAIKLRDELNRPNVVIACLAGSFCHDNTTNDSYLLCEKFPQLAFFSGFHRHSDLRNPLDSFTANFTHPDSITAAFGSYLLDKLSPNIQVSAGVHNLECQYIKASKNMASIFSGFALTFHQENPGLLPTILTLLSSQCLDQAASISMIRKDRDTLYLQQTFTLNQLGYGVQRIEASLLNQYDKPHVRDHTFSQLTAVVADINGSLIKPLNGKPTRNFQAGVVLAQNINRLGRCPEDLNEFLIWCADAGLKQGALEGLNSLKIWPDIRSKYQIPLNDCSLVNLLYMSIYASKDMKQVIHQVLTQSRELSNYCQESVSPSHTKKVYQELNSLDKKESFNYILDCILNNSGTRISPLPSQSNDMNFSQSSSAYLRAIQLINDQFN